MEFVLIHGSLFPTKAKAPFVLSGYSFLGALEYEPESDRVKCHECGKSFVSLTTHVRGHGVTARQYRIRHGLAQATALCGRREAERDRTTPVRTHNDLIEMRRAAYAVPRAVRQKSRVSPETLNLRNTCRAQLIHRLQEMARRYGRTPTQKEMTVWGLSTGSLVKVFGSVKAALKLAELKPRAHGVRLREKAACA